jgi:methylmalonyl-CoA/ethylmalonyl-CoA epimerase
MGGNVSAVTRINHIAVVVEDIETALDFWQDALGMNPGGIHDIEQEKSRVAFFPLEDSQIELVQPIDENSGVAKFLKKRGQGMHHICLEVEGIETLVEKLLEKGIRVLNPELLRGKDGTRYTFIHPSSTGGVLVELYSKQNS